jgi:hypothetical protein
MVPGIVCRNANFGQLNLLRKDPILEKKLHRMRRMKNPQSTLDRTQSHPSSKDIQDELDNTQRIQWNFLSTRTGPQDHGP